MRYFSQFLLLLWKNITLEIRQPSIIVLKALVPLIGVIILFFIRQIFQDMSFCFKTFPVDKLTIPALSSYTVYYAPNNSEVQDLISNIQIKLAESNGELEGFSTQEEFISAIQASLENRSAGCFLGGAAIYFDNISTDNVEYTIRLRSETYTGSWNLDTIIHAREALRTAPTAYFDEGFLHLQKIVDESIIQWKTGRQIEFNVDMKQLPSPSYTDNNFDSAVNLVHPLSVLLLLSFIYTFSLLCKELVYEKEYRLRETMKIMGLRSSVHFTSWFIKEFLQTIPTSIILALILKYGQILPSTSFWILFLFIDSVVLCGIAFAFLLSTFVNSTTQSLLVSFTAVTLQFIPGFFLIDPYVSLPLGVKFITCLLPNSCLVHGLNIIVLGEETSRAITFDSNFKTSPSDDGFPFAFVLMMLAIDFFILMSLAVYFDAVIPGKYGVPKPFYFFLSPSFWCRKKTKQISYLHEDMELNEHSRHEPPEPDAKIDIVFYDTTKIYNRINKKRSRVAVDKLNFVVYKHQITVLLGRNGAGKTTTMSMLTGLIPPTSGRATIAGHDIVNDIGIIRDNLGICPQHSVLFDRLTVSENLHLFGILKGLSNQKVKEEIDDLLTDLELSERFDVLAMNLSGGMKKKLSVAIALIGRPEFVILDEPTSGMDPYSRRLTMNVIIKYKNMGQQTFLLSTHYMDEADILGDRIVILAQGKLKCSGSPLFLKNRYGAGYYLVIEKDSSCDVAMVMDAIKKIISKATLSLDVGTEIHVILPRISSSQFPKVLDMLEEQQSILHICEFGITASSLEQVLFSAEKDLESFKVRRSRQVLDLEEDQSLQEHTLNDITLEDTENNLPDISSTKKPSKILNSGIVLFLQQLYAMLVKQLISDLRSWKAYILKGIIPIIFVTIGFGYQTTTDFNLTVIQNDKTTLSLSSSISAENKTLFWADFDSNNLFSFENIDSAVLGSTEFFNYTQYIEDIMTIVENDNISDINRCCEYEDQILDKYCASRLQSELEVCSGSSTFGYSACPSCLSCSTAINTGRPATCTLPNYEGQVLLIEADSCPNPPKISISQRNEENYGLLDSISEYVDQKLLQVGKDDIFQYRCGIMGGFVIHDEDPVYETCGCSNNSETCNRLSLTLLSAVSTLDISSGDSCTYSNTVDNCNALNEQLWFNNYSSIVDACLLYSLSSNCSSDDHFGRTSIPVLSNPNTVLTIWYSNQYLHTPPVLLNTLYNMYLINEDTNISITINNHPLPLSGKPAIVELAVDFSPVLAVIVITVGVSIFFSVFIFRIVEERETNAQHLQIISGINLFTYRLSFILYDLVTSSIILIILLVIAFSLNYRENVDGFGAIAIVIVLSCWSSLFMMHSVSSCFKQSFTAYGTAFLIFFSTAALFSVIYYFIAFDNQNLADIIHYIFAISPTYALGSAILFERSSRNVRELCTQSSETESFCQSQGIDFVSSSFQFSVPGVSHLYVYFVFEIVLATIIIFINALNFSYLKFFNSAADNDEDNNQNQIDDDHVIKESNSVANTDFNESETAVRLKNVRKKFVSSIINTSCRLIKLSKVAVNDINIDIAHGECFGLLGVNGAGKTTTFKILTGGIVDFDGDVIIGGYDLRKNIKHVRQIVGYCPQFDSLNEHLTGRELLTMYARIRGIKEKDIEKAVQTEIDRLDLGLFANKVCGGYSGGNKRKLSTAIALIGDTDIVLLDEPTTGMDPVTRRFVWKILLDLVKMNKTIIITSHSMEECEAVCTRMAIMVNGQFKCLGTSQHLKNKYGSGYTVEFKLRPVNDIEEAEAAPIKYQRYSRKSKPGSTVIRSISRSFSLRRPSVTVQDNLTFDSKPVKTFFQETFPKAVFINEHQGLVTYRIPSEIICENKLWHCLVGCDQNRDILNILDYTVSQSTLEDVFLSFAKSQHEH